jgi:hypothetical protein
VVILWSNGLQSARGDNISADYRAGCLILTWDERLSAMSSDLQSLFTVARIRPVP